MRGFNYLFLLSVKVPLTPSLLVTFVLPFFLFELFYHTDTGPLSFLYFSPVSPLSILPEGF